MFRRAATSLLPIIKGVTPQESLLQRALGSNRQAEAAPKKNLGLQTEDTFDEAVWVLIVLILCLATTRPIERSVEHFDDFESILLNITN